MANSPMAACKNADDFNPNWSPEAAFARSRARRAIFSQPVDKNEILELEQQVAWLTSKAERLQEQLAETTHSKALLMGQLERIKALLEQHNLGAIYDKLEVPMLQRQVTPHDILKAVNEVSGIRRAERHSSRRHALLVRWRMIEMYVLKSKTSLSYPHIGQIVGGRDHSTVMHAVAKIDSHYGRYSQDIALVLAVLARDSAAAEAALSEVTT